MSDVFTLPCDSQMSERLNRYVAEGEVLTEHCPSAKRKTLWRVLHLREAGGKDCQDAKSLPVSSLRSLRAEEVDLSLRRGSK